MTELLGVRAPRTRIALAAPVLPPLETYRAALEDVWASGMLSNDGVHNRRFEAACATYGAWPYAVATSSCDLGLTLTIAALGLPRATRVLLPSLTFPSTLHAVLWNGLAPCFVDVEPDGFCLDPAAVESELAVGAGLIVATHAFGAAADLAALEQLADAAGAALVLDGAHAFATLVDGEHVGRRGTATVFSFSPTKLVTCGEGGMVATADPELAERLRLLRAYGRDGASEESLALGLNAKLSELHAALGTLGVDGVEEHVMTRERLAARYRDRLADLEGVRLQHVRPGERPSRTFLAVDCGEHRPAVEARLTAEGIQSRRYFRPLHGMDHFADVARASLPVTEALGAGLLCLPLHAGLGRDDVDEVADAVRTAVGAAA